MEMIMEKLIDASTGIAAAALTGALWMNLRWLIRSKKDLEDIKTSLSGMRTNIHVLFRIQGPLLLSLKATLEAQRDGKCNGNVEKALKHIEEIREVLDEFLLSNLDHTRED